MKVNNLVYLDRDMFATMVNGYDLQYFFAEQMPEWYVPLAGVNRVRWWNLFTNHIK